ncbi:uncharacterized protein B0I36DRAFT_433127 [Microdochium trichocladiopsis]|uniref:Uncharacterized protein n=1 Tax=Microdochium trichocladiopsis TaxID=1682393 RepID=A0A9P8Y4V1_9PEZI|nr:uncharacterized protein B0I36DRAFT_433127 [Microdochium trichocladiopsis]KAH7027972.1 hypothetical protein B0I36DRAFT_433127 [Microdochium trichocladiopsis]
MNTLATLLTWACASWRRHQYPTFLTKSWGVSSFASMPADVYPEDHKGEAWGPWGQSLKVPPRSPRHSPCYIYVQPAIGGCGRLTARNHGHQLSRETLSEDEKCTTYEHARKPARRSAYIYGRTRGQLPARLVLLPPCCMSCELHVGSSDCAKDYGSRLLRASVISTISAELGLRPTLLSLALEILTAQ